jgi:hypothetical protein
MNTAEDLFLGIIESVESGLMTPEEAVTELASLKQDYNFKSDYTLDDFQRIRESCLSTLPEDEDFFDDTEDEEDYE